MNNQHSRDDLQPDTIARPGRTPRQSTSLRSVLNKKAGAAGTRFSMGRGTSVFAGPSNQQRVTVKIHLVRHHSAHYGQGSLARHIRYLSRDGVTRDESPAKLQGMDGKDVDARAVPTEWANDRHHFRVIVSPERGADLSDLQAYTRELLKRVERDLGTPLEVLSTSHFNTDSPHSHILLRGRSDGRDLVINKDYIKSGFRERAQQLATEELGTRTRSHARSSMQKQIHAERWTELDCVIERLVAKQGRSSEINLSEVRLRPGAVLSVEMLSQRLKMFEGLGLATSSHKTQGKTSKHPGVTTRRWTLADGYAKALRDLGERNDVIKQIHLAVGKDAQKVLPYFERMQNNIADRDTPSTIVGKVVAKGPVDELTDRRFVLVKDLNSSSPRAIQAYVPLSQEYDAVVPGSIVNLYGSGFRNAALTVQSKQDFDQQVTAKAWTWLDRQLYRHQVEREDRSASELAPEVRRALQDRAIWLVTQGYAGSLTTRVTPENLRFKSGLSKQLKRNELDSLVQAYPDRLKKDWSVIRPGQSAVGKFVETKFLHQGTVAIVETKKGTLIAPLLRSPKGVSPGMEVEVSMSTDKRVKISALSKTKAKQMQKLSSNAIELGGGR